ncbi:MAG: diadenylate cyclase CdaA [Thermodesulfobacteriota bacterium]
MDLGYLQVSWLDFLDVGLVAFLFYHIILLLKGTRAISVLLGLALVAIAYYISAEMGLLTLHWLLGNFLSSFFLVVVILFQRDIRKALAAMGAGRLWKRGKVDQVTLDELVLALINMSRIRVGALVVVEKNMPLGDVLERGVEIKAKFSRKLLETIFYPGTALHDGAVVIRGNTIEAAGCILPLAVGMKHGDDYGTRHRAALGITDESDAIAIVVSEERGSISVAIGGRLTTSLDEKRLRRVLTAAWEKK